MALWRQTTYTEFIGNQGAGASPQISIANDASWATRILDVDWNTQIQACDDFLGYQRVLSTGLVYPYPSGYITRITPMPFPFYFEQYPGQDLQFYQPGSGPRYRMYCTKINRIQGIGAAQPTTAGGVAQAYSTDSKGLALALYQKARMELGFESLAYDILPDNDQAIVAPNGFPDESLLTRYVTKIPGASSDYISLNYGLMLYAEGPNKNSAVPFAPGKIVVSHDLRYRWELVPKEAVPSLAVTPTLQQGSAASGGSAAIEFCLGRVNQSTFGGTGGYPPGTLLLTAAAIIPIRGANGRRLFTVEYFFKLLTTGHHKFYSPLGTNPLTTGWAEISTDGQPHAINSSTPDGVHVYDVADFAWLFRPPNDIAFPAN